MAHQFVCISPVYRNSELTLLEDMSASRTGDHVFIGSGLRYLRQPVDKVVRTLVVFARKRNVFDEWLLPALTHANRIFCAYQIDSQLLFLAYFRPMNGLVYARATIERHVDEKTRQSQTLVTDVREMLVLRNDPCVLTVGVCVCGDQVYLIRQYQEIFTYPEIYVFNCRSGEYECRTFVGIPPGPLHLMVSERQLLIYSDSCAWDHLLVVGPNFKRSPASVGRIWLAMVEPWAADYEGISFTVLDGEIHFLACSEKEEKVCHGRIEFSGAMQFDDPFVITEAEMPVKICADGSGSFFGVRLTERNGYAVVACRFTVPSLELMAVERLRACGLHTYINPVVKLKHNLLYSD